MTPVNVKFIIQSSSFGFYQKSPVGFGNGTVSYGLLIQCRGGGGDLIAKGGFLFFFFHILSDSLI